MKIKVVILFTLLCFISCNTNPEKSENVDVMFKFNIEGEYFEIDSATATISGEDINNIQQTIDISGNTFYAQFKNLPTGKNRIIKISTFNSIGKNIYVATDTVDINSSGTIELTLSLFTVNSEIQEMITGAIAYYKFDGNAMDSTRAFNAVTHGEPTYTSDRKGKSNSAIRINSNSYLELPNMDLVGDVSLFSWVMVHKTNGDPLVAILAQGMKDIRWHAEIKPDFLVFYDDRKGDNSPYLISADVGYDKWVHFGMVSSDSFPQGSKVKLFLNGKNIGSVSSRPLHEERDTTLSVGRYFNGIWKGCEATFDDLSIYKKILSDKEVQSLYNNQSK